VRALPISPDNGRAASLTTPVRASLAPRFYGHGLPHCGIAAEGIPATFSDEPANIPGWLCMRIHHHLIQGLEEIDEIEDERRRTQQAQGRATLVKPNLVWVIPVAARR
jgi:hypothetical protein